MSSQKNEEKSCGQPDRLVQDGTAKGEGVPGSSGYQYGHLILFKWDPDLPTPFKVLPREDLEEIKEEWLQKKLSIDQRRRVLKFHLLDKIETSFFAKIQRGNININLRFFYLKCLSVKMT